MPKGRTVVPALGWAADKPTTKDIGIDMSVWRAQDFSSGSSSSSSRRGGSRVEPSKRLVGEYVECRQPAEVERVEPTKRRAVLSKRGHPAICIRRESADGFGHGGLSGSSDEVLCAASRAWARGGWGGQLVELERCEAANPTVYALLLLLLLRSAVEREAEWGVGVRCLGGGRESGNEACRSIRRWEGSDGRERRAELHEALLLLLCCTGRIGGVSAGQGINERFFGPAFALVVKIQSHSPVGY